MYPVLMEVRREHQFQDTLELVSWSLWATMWMLGIERGFSARISALYWWALSLSPCLTLLLFSVLSILELAALGRLILLSIISSPMRLLSLFPKTSSLFTHFKARDMLTGCLYAELLQRTIHYCESRLFIFPKTQCSFVLGQCISYCGPGVYMVLQSEFRVKASFYSDKLTGVSKETQNSLKELCKANYFNMTWELTYSLGNMSSKEETCHSSIMTKSRADNIPTWALSSV